MNYGSKFGMAIAVLCVLGLTQGCVTTKSEGSGRGAGAKTRGPFKHEHKGKAKASSNEMTADAYMGYDEDATIMDEESVISETDYVSTIEPLAPIEPADSSTGTYIVQKGDVLSKIASKFDTTTANLVSMNNLSNPDVLYVGQELRVPAGSGSSASSSFSSSSSSSSIKRGGTYTIQKGDTLSGIAVAAGVSLNDLRSLNGIDGDKIMAGESLDIPAYGKVPAARASSSSSSSSTKKSSTPEPAPAPVEPAPAPAAPAPAPAEPIYDTPAPVEPASATMEVDMVVDEVIYPGETLDTKARQYGVSKAEIMRINGITDESQVREGQTIRIPVAE